MGNYSRNTFDKNKGYSSVRLQQGVPLVDADWNELADILRHQTDESLDFALGSGAPAGHGMTLSGTGLQNDFNINLGTVMVRGRLLQLGTIKYSTQPWTNATKAAQDGVAVIPPLTTPGAPRIDCVYLDVWEREVNSLEDSNLVNPVIGVETAVRTKWERAVRVQENANFLPVAPAGHVYMRVALLKRTAGVAAIGSYDAGTTSGSVLDIRPTLPAGGSFGILNVAPCFFETSGSTPWRNVGSDGKMRSIKEGSSAYGLIPVTLPHGACISQLTVRGFTSSFTTVWLVRSDLTTVTTNFGSDYIYLLTQTISGPLNGSSHFFTSWAMDDRDPLNRVDNRNFLYSFFASASGSGLAEIHKITIDYTK